MWTDNHYNTLQEHRVSSSMSDDRRKSQSAPHFIQQVFDGAEFIFQLKWKHHLDFTLCTHVLAHWNRKGPLSKCFHTASKYVCYYVIISLRAVAMWFLWIRAKGPSPDLKHVVFIHICWPCSYNCSYSAIQWLVLLCYQSHPTGY